MSNVICYIKEFEGIIGTVLGSVGILIVTDILKRKGKLNIYLMKYDGEFWYFDKNLRGLSKKKSENCDISYYKVNFVLDVYNSSELPKIMRDIKVNIYKDKKLLGHSVVKDSNAKRVSETTGYVIADNVNIFNIKAKESVSLNLEINLSKEIAEQLSEGLVLKLCYKNEKNKEQYFEISNKKIYEQNIKE